MVQPGPHCISTASFIAITSLSSRLDIRNKLLIQTFSPCPRRNINQWEPSERVPYRDLRYLSLNQVVHNSSLDLGWQAPSRDE